MNTDGFMGKVESVAYIGKGVPSVTVRFAIPLQYHEQIAALDGEFVVMRTLTAEERIVDEQLVERLTAIWNEGQPSA